VLVALLSEKKEPAVNSAVGRFSPFVPFLLRLPESAEQSQLDNCGAEEGNGPGLRHCSDLIHVDIVQAI